MGEEHNRLDFGRGVALLLLALLSLPIWFFLVGLADQALAWHIDFEVGAVLALLLALVSTALAHRAFASLAFPLVGAFLLGCLSVVMVGQMVPRGPTLATRCKSNLKNLGTAMEMYSTDYDGCYPDSLSQLTPNYLKTIPTCPAAEKVTYRQGFASQEDAYTLMCGGHHHAELERNFPQYTSAQGLR